MRQSNLSFFVITRLGSCPTKQSLSFFVEIASGKNPRNDVLWVCFVIARLGSCQTKQSHFFVIARNGSNLTAFPGDCFGIACTDYSVNPHNDIL